jgi:branched-chain amino acid aminotransferase
VIQAELVWHDGALRPFAEARTHVAAFGLHYGVGLFEGVRCYRRGDGRSAVFRLREHVARFFQSAKIGAIPLAIDPEALTAACLETVRANRLDECYVRPVAFVGAGALGMGATSNATEVAVIAFGWGPALGEAAIRDGIRAHVSSYTRGHPNALMSKAKLTGQYLASVLAKRESQRLGQDEAILLDAHGRVCEGPAENLFLVERGALVTPSLDLPILAGITRDAVLTLAREQGLAVREAAFTRDALYSADEVFMTGTAIEIAPVREIDGRPVGEGRPGPVTRRLQEAFYACVRGPGEPHPEWLTYV